MEIRARRAGRKTLPGFLSGWSASRFRGLASGRSAARLARLVRDQEVGGSNPLAPTEIRNDLALRWSACCHWSGSSPFAATCSYKDLGLQCWTPLPLPLLTPRRWTPAEAVIAAFSWDNVAGRHAHMVAESSHRREDALEGAPEGRSANERYRARSPQAGESGLHPHRRREVVGLRIVTNRERLTAMLGGRPSA